MDLDGEHVNKVITDSEFGLEITRDIRNRIKENIEEQNDQEDDDVS